MTRKNADKSFEDRKLREVQHSDQRRTIVKAYEYQTDAGARVREKGLIADKQSYYKHFSNMKFYSITSASSAYRDSILLEGIEGLTALDYCCGNGEVAVEMACKGARLVHGIDLSPVAIENARELAKSVGVDAICEFSVMDAEQTDFEDDTFDIIHEYGALHHLKLKAAFRELSRLVKSEGRVVCTETLRHNPFIHLYRKRTPHLRTKWEVEHILGTPEIMCGLQYFKEVYTRFFHLSAIGAVPFRKKKIFNGLLSALDAVDSILLRIPYLQRMAWIAVFLYEKPDL